MYAFSKGVPAPTKAKATSLGNTEQKNITNPVEIQIHIINQLYKMKSTWASNKYDHNSCH